jgi:hypothetical protein
MLGEAQVLQLHWRRVTVVCLVVSIALWGVMSVAFLRPLPPPMHAAFYLIYNGSFYVHVLLIK